ncbi:MAG: hypothetical protein FIA99_02655 [Ruminiclostridium sp.]|nr:hypothetical protein [Ruminiclostridium sp.]
MKGKHFNETKDTCSNPQPIDIQRWAYKYSFKSSEAEACAESDWICDAKDSNVIYGLAWEEPRRINKINIELDEDCEWFAEMVLCEYWAPTVEWQNSRPWTWYQGNWQPYPQYCRCKSPKTFIFEDSSIRTMKLRFRVTYPSFDVNNVPSFSVKVFTDAWWKRETLEIEWGFDTQGISSNRFVDGTISAYNGIIENVSALCGKGCNGSVSIKKNEGGAHTWQCLSDNSMQMGINVSLLKAEWAEQRKGRHFVPNKTVITLTTTNGTVSFAPDDLDSTEGIYIPSKGLYIRRKSTGCSAQKWLENIKSRAPETIREKVRKEQEQDWNRILKEIGTRPVPKDPKTTGPKSIEIPMKVKTPDWRFNMAWKLGPEHLLAYCDEEKDGSWDIRIGPYPMIGMESCPIITVFDILGLHDMAKSGLNKCLEQSGQRKPDGLYRFKEGCLCFPYGIKHGDSWLYLDPPSILIGLAEHYFITKDKEWLEECSEKIKACCEWLLTERKWHMVTYPNGSKPWDYGLLPPARGGDMDIWESWYQMNAYAYSALTKSAKVLAVLDGEYAALLENKALEFKNDILTAVKKSMELSPVKPIRNGIFVPMIPPFPYLRGMGVELVPPSPSIGRPWLDIDHSAIALVHMEVIDPQSIEADWILDILEDNFMLDASIMPKKWDQVYGVHPDTKGRDTPAMMTDYDVEKDWFSWGGTGWQNGYYPLAQVYLSKDDISCFIRTFYNTYALHVDLESYWMREHAATLRYPPKTFEEALFLHRLRDMLIYEYEDILWIAKAVPRSWLDAGCSIEVENAATKFGMVSYCIDSKINGLIDVKLKLPNDPKIGNLYLKLRYTKGVKIAGVKVNGQIWEDFDDESEIVRLKEASGDIHVCVNYLDS